MPRLKRKSFLSFVSITLALLIQFTALTPLSARAADNPFDTSPFIKGITLTDLTTGQQLGGGAVAGKTDDVRIRYDYEIPDDVTVSDGTTYTFTVPNEILIPSAGFSEPLTMTDTGGNQVQIATVSIASGGNGVITFNGSANNYRGVSGYFNVESHFTGNSIANTTPVPLKFTVQGQTDPTTINVNFKQPATSLTKSNGVYHADTDKVSWTVTVNSNKTTVTDGKFTDTLPSGLSYAAGTFTVKDSSGTVVYKDGAAGNTLGSFNGPSNPLEYDFGKTVADVYTVTYDTAVNPDYYGKTLTNTSMLDQDGTDVTAQGTVTPSPIYIVKKADPAVKPGDTKINWTITFNQAGGPLSDVAVSDDLSGVGTLDSGSGVVLDSGTAGQVALTGAGSQYYTYQNNQLVFHAATLTGQHTLNFSTDLPSDYWQQNQGGIANSAILAASNNSYLQRGVTAKSGTVTGTGNTVISKDGAGYEAASHTITWKITVGSAGLTLPSPIVTDVIPTTNGNAQTYVPGSFTVTDKNGTVVYKDGGSGNTLGSFDTSTPGTLKYQFGQDISSIYTIIYQTTVNQSSIYANNTDTTFKNSAVLTTQAGAGLVSSDDGSQRVKSTVLQKSANYDYVNRELTWTIAVNQSQMPLTGVKVTDVLTGKDANGNDTGLDNFTLETDTLYVGDTQLNKGTSAADLIPGQFYYDTGTKTLTVDLGNIGTATEAVTFKMKLNDPNVYFAANGSKSVSNTAQLTDDQYGPVSVTTGYTIENGLVTKTGDYTANNDYIDWIVHINQNAVRLSDLKLTDQLPDGLILDTSSIRLYPQILGNDGSLTPNGATAGGIDSAAQSAGVPAVSLDGSNISYNAGTREFGFTLPSDSGSGTEANPYAVTKPYVLIFRTYVDEAHRSDSFTNTISFSGNAETQGSTSSPVAVWYASGGGGATGATGSLTVTKSDSVNTSAALANAKFGLFDQYGNQLQTSTTDSNGSLTFSFLRYSVPYSIQELAAPENYQRSSVIHSFELKKGSSAGLYEYNSHTNDYTDFVNSTLTYAYTDTLKTGTIRLAKVDQSGTVLGGAVFTLYDAGGNPVGDPQTSGPDGLVAFSGVPYGVYTVRETGVPADYMASGDGITANLTDGNGNVQSGTLDLGAVTNTIRMAGIQLTKLGAGGEKLRGATFTLYDSTGKNVLLIGGSPVTATSDADGLAVFQTVYGPSSIPYGDYIVKETAPPADYTPCAAISVSLHAGNSALSNGVLTLGIVSDALKLGSITFTKLDENGSGLAGAAFVLKDANGNPVGDPQISDRNGKVTFENVPYGDGYSVTETQAPADYTALSAPVMGISLHTPQVVLQSVTDSRLTGGISLTKVDESGNPLAGAEFTLYDPSGKQVGSPQTSDKYGRVAFANVPFKDGYTIRETKAPENYAIHAAFTVNLHTDSYDYGKVVDDLLRGDIQVKKTDPSGRPLAGSTFTLYDANGKAVGKAVSDSNGVAVFPDVPYGDYTVRETAAPEGYGIDKDAHKVSLNARNPVPFIQVIDEKIPLIPNPKTRSEKGLPLAEAGVLALALSGIILSGKLRFGKRKEK